MCLQYLKVLCLLSRQASSRRCNTTSIGLSSCTWSAVSFLHCCCSLDVITHEFCCVVCCVRYCSFPMGFLSDRLYAGIARKTFRDIERPGSALYGVTKVAKTPAATAWAAEHYPGQNNILRGVLEELFVQFDVLHGGGNRLCDSRCCLYCGWQHCFLCVNESSLQQVHALATSPRTAHASKMESSSKDMSVCVDLVISG